MQEGPESRSLSSAPSPCVYVRLRSRIHKHVVTSDDHAYDRLNPSLRHVLVQAMVTTELRYHTRHLSHSQRTANQSSQPSRGVTYRYPRLCWFMV